MTIYLCYQFNGDFTQLVFATKSLERAQDWAQKLACSFVPQNVED